MPDIGTKVSDWLDLPLGAVAAMPGLFMEGNRRLRFENHRGVREYTDTCLRIASNMGILRVEGKGLQLRVFESAWVLVEGVIERISFEHLQDEGERDDSGTRHK